MTKYSTAVVIDVASPLMQWFMWNFLLFVFIRDVLL